jgi:putative addiction module CopG family antidote
MATTSMNISLTKNLRDYVLRKVKEDDHVNASDFLRGLIRKERKREQAQESFDVMIGEGLNSGVATQIDWDNFRTKALVRHETKNKS